MPENLAKLVAGRFEDLSPGFPASEVFCSAIAFKDVFHPWLSAGTRSERSSCSRKGFGKYRSSSMLATRCAWDLPPLS